MTLPAEDTLLIMTPTGVPLYAARGLTQTITPVVQAKPAPRRTINGTARFIGGSQMRKYDTVISCTDQNAPPFSGLWAGDTVTVESVAEMSYRTIGGTPDRAEVTGTTREVGAFTLYRPILVCMVVDFEQSFEEYGVQYQWRLSLTEV